MRAPWVSIFAALRGVRTAWPTRGWSWDSRQSCVTSSFNAELRSAARTAASATLVHEWTTATIQRAAPALRAIAERTDLRTGQILMASDAVGGAFAYGLWWPWGDDITTSIRIGLDGIHVTADVFDRFRDLFGVEP